MGKITIQELAKVLVDKKGLAPREASEFSTKMFALILERLRQDDQVKIKGLGTFKIIRVEARESVSVRTGERVVIDSHEKVTFTPDTLMKELVNRPFSQFETVVLNDGVEFADIASTTAEDDADDAEDPDEYVPAGQPSTVQASEQVEVAATSPLIDIAEPTLQPKPEVQQQPEPVTVPQPEPIIVPQPEPIPDPVPEPVITPQPEPIPDSVPEPVIVPQSEAIPEAVIEKRPEQVIEPEQEPVIEIASEPTLEADANPEPVLESSIEPEPSTEAEPKHAPMLEPRPRMRARHKMERRTTDDESKPTAWWKWPLAAAGVLLLMAVSAIVGYYYGTSQAPASVITDTIERVDTVIMVEQYDSEEELEAVDGEAAEMEGEAPAEKKTEPAAGKKTEPAAETQKPATKPAQEKTTSSSESTDPYAAKDVRVRLGAYRIVGLDHEVKVQEGQTFYSICRAHLGPDMECYVEVFNDLPSEPVIKVGQVIKIPKLQLKKRNR